MQMSKVPIISGYELVLQLPMQSVPITTSLPGLIWESRADISANMENAM
jgi:hypothetical protein